MSISIHIHEDDWGLRNLYPVAALGAAAADVDEAARSGRENIVPDGIGWTNVHVIRAPSVDFTSTGLSVATLGLRLQAIMPRIRRFVATATAGFSGDRRDPYGSYDDDAWCFGFDAGCFLKLEISGDLVRHVWFEARPAGPQQLAALRRAIETVDAQAEAVIADYVEDAAGRVRDAAFMDRYFADLGGAA